MIIDARRTGRTTALLKAAKEIGAVFVTQTEAVADSIRKLPEAKGVTILSIDKDFNGGGEWGTPTLDPVSCALYDHTVLEGQQREIMRLRNALRTAHEKKAEAMKLLREFPYV